MKKLLRRFMLWIGWRPHYDLSTWRKVGRPRIYQSNAEKQRAYRSRKKEICPSCFCGRVGSEGGKPQRLRDTFSDCPDCGGSGMKKEPGDK